LQYVVLAALVLAAAVIAFDTAQQRARRRSKPDVGAAHRGALAVDPTVAEASLVLPAERRSIEDLPEELGGLWAGLGDLLDLGSWKPKIAPGVELREFRVRWGDDYALIATPDHTSHFQLEIWEARLVGKMDGNRTVDELIVDRLEDEGELDASAVAGLVEMLRVEGLLDPPPLDVKALVVDRLDPASPRRRKLREFGKTLKIGWDGAERFTKACYRGGLKYAFRPVGVAVCAAISVAGVIALIITITSGRFVLDLRTAPVEAAILLTLAFFLTACHELAHALVLVHYERRVITSGFMIFFGSPAFFVDASDVQMLDRGPRIVQAFAGPWAELVLAGVASLVLLAFPEAGFAPLVYRFAVINYFVIFENLIPLLRLDGYWILCDLIEEPDLRGRSLAFIQRDLWHKLATRAHISLQDIGLALYGVIGTIYSVFSIWIGLYFWQRLFGGIVGELWRGGIWSQILLVALVLAFVGPVIRAAVDAARALIRRVKAVVARIRFRLERSWRIEAAQLIDALPGFDDLPEDVLSDLAGRVSLRTLPPGRAIFRQGDRPDAFYVVRSGALDVEDTDPQTGDTRVLRSVERGDAFGEVGLVDMAPRSATVRAATSSQVFRIDKNSFDRLLADAIEAPTFAPTMQAIAELRELPAYRRLATDQLAEVLEHGGWRTYVAGEAILEQGAAGDAFYVIRSGRAEVDRDGVAIAELGPGDHFGELALLHDAPRSASVVALTALRAFRLDRAGFDEVVAEQFARGRSDEPRKRDMEH
jgi:CRP-like cAMP-binding protein/Zn-dependent protease